MDQFDKYLKDKLENAEVPFNEQHWNEFQKSLAKQTRVKRLRKIGIAAAVTVVIATSVFIYVKNNFNETPVDEHKEQKAELVSNDNNNNALKAEQVESDGGKFNKEESTENKKLVVATEQANENVQQTELTEQKTQENIENNTTEKITISTSDDNELTENRQEQEVESDETSKNSLYLKAINTLSIEVSNYNTCAGTPIQVKLINPENLPLKDIEWTFGDGYTEKGEKSTHVYKFSGEYQVLCIVNNNFEEPVKIQAKNKVMVNKLPNAEIVYQNMWEQYDNNKLFYPYTQFKVKTIDAEPIALHWSFGNGKSLNGKNVSTIYEEKKTYNVKLLITDGNGCSNTIETEVYNNEGFDILAPNAFTPNNDGNNDTFYPKAIKEFNVPCDITIKDISGKIVFKGTQENCEWNGTYMNTGSPLPEGVYIYTVTTSDVEGKKHQFAGKVNLLR